MRMPLFALVLFLIPVAAGAQEKEVIKVPGSLEGLPFSSAVRVGNMLYLSGQVGALPGSRELAAGGIAAETRQAMENIKQVLEYAGSSLDQVVKCTVFLLDIGDYSAMNEVYASYFANDPPARSTLAASGLALGARVEIECIAVVER
ncbi:MAG: RidA family protein [Gemmatimonadota bacterium]|nr:MAG: RidA family protein [Gemmatimonadota bacterium]